MTRRLAIFSFILTALFLAGCGGGGKGPLISSADVVSVARGATSPEQILREAELGTVPSFRRSGGEFAVPTQLLFDLRVVRLQPAAPAAAKAAVKEALLNRAANMNLNHFKVFEEGGVVRIINSPTITVLEGESASFSIQIQEGQSEDQKGSTLTVDLTPNAATPVDPIELRPFEARLHHWGQGQADEVASRPVRLEQRAWTSVSLGEGSEEILLIKAEAIRR
ncbi:MAG: hypothetical protein RLY93_05590 [Sumerlaeia bacterium]